MSWQSSNSPKTQILKSQCHGISKIMSSVNKIFHSISSIPSCMSWQSSISPTAKKTKSRRSVKSPGILSLYILHIIVYSALHIAKVTSKIISYVSNIYLSHSIFSIALHIANHDKAAIVGKDYLHRKVFFFIPAWRQSSNGRTCCRSLLRHTFSQVSA